MHSDGQPCHLYQHKNVFACPEPVPEFPTLCVVFFILVSDIEVIGGFLDIDEIVHHHGLKTVFS